MKVHPEQALTGLGLTFAVSVLVPMLRRTGNLMWGQGREGLAMTAHEMQKRLEYVGAVAREELEDFMAEVEFERFKRKIDRDIGSEGPSHE